ncbi:hypothetical protein SynSYN20_01270 [Synechococcus sp. SYN20]|nr:hypothetical protein SynSYN20_01270 [Synechococcus sp. SYN20]
MSPHLADVAGNSNRHTSSTNWLTDSIFQFKAFKTISRPTRIDVFSKWSAGFPRPFNGWEAPDNQIMLHGGSIKSSFTRYSND